MMPDTRSPDALNARQFGARANAYVQSLVHAQGPDIVQMVEIASQIRNANVLDLGCGGGHVSYAAAPAAKTVTAYDLAPEMLTAVEAEAKKRNLTNIVTRQGPAESLPFPAASFDAVLCRYTAHHWQDAAAGVREARRVLKPGGVAVFADIVAPESAVLDTFLQTFEMLRDPSHVRDYSTTEWVGFAAQAGFAVTGVTRRRLPLDFESWTARQRTPPVLATAIRALQKAVSEPVRTHFELAANGDFVIDEVVFEFAPI